MTDIKATAARNAADLATQQAIEVAEQQVATLWSLASMPSDASEESAERLESLRLALEAGADPDTLRAIFDALRVGRGPTVVLPPGKYEGLSRGRGWARRLGTHAWGERVDGGYRVGPGRWSVGSSDGFRRKADVSWDVRHVVVGDAVWTVAS